MTTMQEYVTKKDWIDGYMDGIDTNRRYLVDNVSMHSYLRVISQYRMYIGKPSFSYLLGYSMARVAKAT